MSSQRKITRQEAIIELRNEADELDSKKCTFSEYARNAYKAKIRRKLADKLEQELEKEQPEK